MDPSKHSKQTIAKNNYDDGTKFQNKQINAGKVDHVVEVSIPKNDPNLVRENSDRNVYRYKGDLQLKKYQHEVNSYDSYQKSKK